MSQRLMLTALKSARLNGVPFGIEERERGKKKNGEAKMRLRDERETGGKNKNKLKIEPELWEII